MKNHRKGSSSINNLIDSLREEIARLRQSELARTAYIEELFPVLRRPELFELLGSERIDSTVITVDYPNHRLPMSPQNLPAGACVLPGCDALVVPTSWVYQLAASFRDYEFGYLILRSHDSPDQKLALFNPERFNHESQDGNTSKISLDRREITLTTKFPMWNSREMRHGL